MNDEALISCIVGIIVIGLILFVAQGIVHLAGKALKGKEKIEEPVPQPAPGRTVSANAPAPRSPAGKTEPVKVSGPAHSTRKCPMCAEEIPIEATACPYCKTRFTISTTGYCAVCHAVTEADEAGRCRTCGNEVADWHVESISIEESMPQSPSTEQVMPAAAAPGLSDEVRRLASQGKMIEAIKIHRQQTGAGLPEAQQVINKYLGVPAVSGTRALAGLIIFLLFIAGGVLLMAYSGLPFFYSFPIYFGSVGLGLFLLGLLTKNKVATRSALVMIAISAVVFLVLAFTSGGIPSISNLFMGPTSTPATSALPSGVSHWPIVYYESFDREPQGWNDGLTDFIQGKLRISAPAQKIGYFWSTKPSGTQSSTGENFCLTVEGRQISGPDDSKYGLLFRRNDGEQFFFTVDNNRHFAFWYMSATVVYLIEPTVDSTIQPGEINRITVLGKGTHYIFFINNKNVAEFDDDHLSGGLAAILIGVDSGESAVFEFDDFEIAAP